jgi:hypothetical protein
MVIQSSRIQQINAEVSMNKTLHPQHALLGLLLLTTPAVAQELRLFEQPEGEAQQQDLPVNNEQVFGQGGQPAYTLRSISRFGDRYEAVLINRTGGTAKVNWRAGETAPLLNSGGFNIVAAGPGTISLTHPAGDSCVTAPAVGVACSSSDRSELRLVVAAPLASNGVMPPQGPQQQADGFFQAADPLGVNAAQGNIPPDVNGQQVFINPFSGEPEVMPQIPEEERVARQQRQELRAARLRQFEQGAQIPDAAIPPGMERVRTPFGDRLIPIRE